MDARRAHLIRAMVSALTPLVPSTSSCEESSSSPHVLVVGACGLDYIAAVDSYPAPDAKVRTQQLSITGGGNAANTAVTLSRLGIATKLISKVGDDAVAKDIRQDLIQDKVDVKHVLTEAHSNSPFTYVIVDALNHTRTCIHTPIKADLTSKEMTRVVEAIRKEKTTPEWIHFDSRHTEASLLLASYASPFKVPMSVDVEKFRPHLEKLLPLCDVIFTNQHFPTLYANSVKGEQNGLSLEESMVLLLEGTSARLVVSTLGSQGSLIVKRDGDDLSDLRSLYPLDSTVGLQTTSLDLLPSKNNLYRGTSYTVIRCPALDLPKGDIVDTTGAGDAFIGGFIFAFLQNFSEEDCLKVATLVAGEKLKSIGSRTGLPSLDRIKGILQGHR